MLLIIIIIKKKCQCCGDIITSRYVNNNNVIMYLYESFFGIYLHFAFYMHVGCIYIIKAHVCNLYYNKWLHLL